MNEVWRRRANRQRDLADAICVSLVMALNRITELEYEQNHPYGELAVDDPRRQS